MERKFLEDLGLEKEIIDKVLDQNSADIGKHKQTIESLTTERDGLKNQLEEAGEEIQSYKDMDIDGIKAKAGEWETKYNNDTKALKEQLDSANYGFAVKEAVSGLKFTSESAKKAFILDLTSKKLPIQDGNLLGLEDFAKAYKENDPGAFESDIKPPMWSKGTGVETPASPLASLRSAMGLPDKKD